MGRISKNNKKNLKILKNNMRYEKNKQEQLKELEKS